MNRVKRFVTTIMLLTGFGMSAFCLTIRLTSYETGQGGIQAAAGAV